MIIKQIDLENFVGFKKIKVNLSPSTTYLVGPNGSGKSTIGLNSIWFALQGIAEKKTNSANPLIAERWRFIGTIKSKATVKLTLIDTKTNLEYVVERILSKSETKLSIKCSDANIKPSQDWLNSLFNLFLISPLYFANLSSQEQCSSLGIDVSAFDMKRKQIKSDIYALNLKIANIDSLPVITPVEKPNKDELMKNYTDATDKNNKFEKLSSELDRAKKDIIAVDIKIANLESLVNSYKASKATTLENIKSLTASLSSIVPVNIAILKEKIAEADALMQKYYVYENYLKTIAPLKELKESKEKLFDDLKAINLSKEEYLKSKNFDIEGLTINEEGILVFHNRPIKPQYFSTGELIMLVVLLQSKLNNDLNFVFIQQFNLLDKENQDKIIDFLKLNKYQALIEYVADTGFNEDCIVLKEFNLVENKDIDSNIDNV